LPASTRANRILRGFTLSCGWGFEAASAPEFIAIANAATAPRIERGAMCIRVGLSKERFPLLAAVRLKAPTQPGFPDSFKMLLLGSRNLFRLQRNDFIAGGLLPAGALRIEGLEAMRFGV
jgi:hypothetical protein